VGAEIIKAHGLDKRAGLDLQTTELASTEAGKIALKGGSADIIPVGLAVGDARARWAMASPSIPIRAHSAPMVPAQSSIRTIDDLKGKTIAVAGGPIDKSWLLLQAFARRSGVDLRNRPRRSMARRRCCRKKRCKGRPTRR
jgi:NitT/TauT family transport system substrate-binding protein